MTEQPTTTPAAATAEDIAAAQAVLASAGVAPATPAPAPAPAAAPTAADIAAAHAVIAAANAPEPVAPLTVHELLRILGDRVFSGDERVMFAEAVTASDPTS